MAALDTFLVHPDIARIHCQVKARRARTDHYHATLFAHEGRDRERRLAKMFEHHINIIALAVDVPDRLSKLKHLGKSSFVIVGIARRQLPPTTEIFAVHNALCTKPHDKLPFAFI